MKLEANGRRAWLCCLAVYPGELGQECRAKLGRLRLELPLNFTHVRLKAVLRGARGRGAG
jgi:hypothetical protein